MAKLASAGLPEPIVELSAIWRARSGAILPLSSRENITPELLKQIEADVARRANGEPIARILATREFYSRDFYLNNACLIPRPDSETIIDALLEIIAQSTAPLKHIHELGCGSGCLIISLATNLNCAKIPQAKNTFRHTFRRTLRRTLSASDKSRKALQAARKNLNEAKNGAKNGAENGAKNGAKNTSIGLSHSDWLQNKHLRASHKFDLIFANPPYLRRRDICHLQREVQNFEPLLALEGGFDGLVCLRAICSQARKRLRVGGLLLLEHSPEQSSALARIAKCRGYLKVKTYRDLSGRERVTLLKRQRSNKTLD